MLSLLGLHMFKKFFRCWRWSEHWSSSTDSATKQVQHLGLGQVLLVMLPSMIRKYFKRRWSEPERLKPLQTRTSKTPNSWGTRIQDTFFFNVVFSWRTQWDIYLERKKPEEILGNNNRQWVRKGLKNNAPACRFLKLSVPLGCFQEITDLVLNLGFHT